MPERLTYWLYAAAWTLVRRLPERSAYAVFAGVADLVWRLRGRAVRQLEANLRRACPGLDEAGLRSLSRAGMRSYLAYWCDVFRLPDWSAQRMVSTVRVVGEQRLRASTGPGRRGLVAALLHMGNWDHAGGWASLTGTPVVTVAERLRPERLYQRFLAYRKALGIEILPLSGGERGLLDTLARRLRAGGLVPLLADRDLRASGVEVSLLGEPARLPPGPAMLALRTGAALHPVSIWHEPHLTPGQPVGRRLVVCFHDEVPAATVGTTRERVTAMTQQVADVFGAAIRDHPQHWHMLAPLWSQDLVRARDRAPAAAGGS